MKFSHTYGLKAENITGATAIETFLDESGETAVLIGAAAGLHLLSATDSVDGGIASTIITQDAIFKSPLKMQIAQDGSFVTAWSLGTNGALGYLTTQISQIATLGTKAYALFPEGMSANFATAISQPDNSKGMAVASQSIVSDDKFGNLTLLQQNRDTGLWKSEPFVVGDNTQVYDVNSYTFMSLLWTCHVVQPPRVLSKLPRHRPVRSFTTECLIT